MSEKTRRGIAVQDTGNVVLDSTVNVAMGAGVWTESHLKQIHEALLALYEKEPKTIRQQNKELAESQMRSAK